MCGIAGAYGTMLRKVLEPETLQRMIDALRHRGPDDEGTYRAGMQAARRPSPPAPLPKGEGRRWPAALPRGEGECWRGPGTSAAVDHRRRLRQTAAGNEDGSVWVVFNGEIYNFRELCGRGSKAPATGSARKATPKCWSICTRTKARNCSAQLNGMFALAIWDARRQQLLLARDRLGKKPLVYRHEPGPAAVRQRVEEPFWKCRACRGRSTRRRSTSI